MKPFRRLLPLLLILSVAASAAERPIAVVETGLPITVSAELEAEESPLSARLTAESNEALVALARFCAEENWPCRSFAPLEARFTREIDVLEGAAVAAEFVPQNEIRVSLASRARSVSLFHELVHWARGEHARREGQDIRADWTEEAIPFLATLLDHPQGAALSESEREFLAHTLSGSLVANHGSSAWYGLVALWTRYLAHHVRSPRALLDCWLARASAPEPGSDWRREDDFDTFEFRGEERTPLPAEHKRFENLFQYFAIALYENSPGINPWSLFELGLPGARPPIEASERWTPLSPGQTIELAPMGFAFTHPGALHGPVRLSSDSARILLWRGSRYAPRPLNGEAYDPRGSRPWERIFLYNPTTSSARVTID